ncbi:hypothetical protein PTKIN_Ptkin06aG0213500 [Pterospermum kingtungense]
MAGSDDAQKKKRIAIIVVSSCLLVAMVVAVTVGVSINEEVEETSNGTKNSQVSASMKAIKSLCQPTDFKKTCEEQLSAEAGNTTDMKELVKAAFKATMKFASRAAKNSTTLRDLEKDPRSKKALDICKQLMTYSINELQKSFDKVENFDFTELDKTLADLKVWLSATVTNQRTCLEGFQNTTTTAGEKMRKALNISMQLSANGLAIADELSTVLSQFDIQGISRRLLQAEDELPVLGHAEYDLELLQPRARRLMEATPSTIKPNIVVAQDGSGDVTTIKAAMSRIPLHATEPFVIYIKEGVYKENLEFVYAMINVVLIGDGKEKTRITGSLNNADGVPTFRTATVAVNGDNFFAKNIGFENSAGPTKFQAVALMVVSDFSVFYNCSMDGYQDTLYVHSKRQFFRDCTVSGTIDFVFGDAQAVFQNCTFVVLKPLDGQQNIITAQGRTQDRQPTALVFQNSTFIAAPELAPLKDKYPTYLGRPWGNMSRTIIMESYIDDLIKPEGWTIWEGTWGLNTCYYAEYNNHGPGSSKTGRVTWPGIKEIKKEEALLYTPADFFTHEDLWIKNKGVPFTPGFFEGSTTSTVPSNTPVTVPNNTPATAPATVPNNTPATMPNKTPATAPATVPNNTPTTTPATVPNNTPATAPATVPNNTPATVPNNTPATAPATVPNNTPATTPETVPNNTPAMAPTTMPNNTPTTVPTTMSNNTPTTAPATVPNNTPATVPNNTPATTPETVPNNTPTTVPNNTPATAPAAVPNNTPAAAPATVPNNIPATAPAIVPIPATAPAIVPNNIPATAPTTVPNNTLATVANTTTKLANNTTTIEANNTTNKVEPTLGSNSTVAT